MNSGVTEQVLAREAQRCTALPVSRPGAAVAVGGASRAIDNWTLSVWERERGIWRLVACQPTAIPK